MRIWTLILCGMIQLPMVAQASSHREAPAIAMDPAADITDVYTFKSPTNPANWVFVMNVSPAALGGAAPNWYRFDDDVLYEMHVDRTGDGIEDVTFQFRFTTNDYRAAKGLIISYFPNVSFDAASNKYTGLLGDGSLNQTYAVSRINSGRRSAAPAEVGAGLLVAPPRIGPYTTDGGKDNKSTAKIPQAYQAYAALAKNAVKDVGSAKFFAGPRNDPFFVDLGGVFDRVAVRIPSVTGTPVDSLVGANVMSIVMELPLTDFLEAGETHFGYWATTSRPQASIRRPAGKDEKVGGGWVQVSRLGNPLVNEVVIKVEDKDKFNNTEPKDDVANFASYVLKPQLAFVLNTLYGPANDLSTVGDFITKIDEEDRWDLVTAFVTGLPGINRHPSLPTDTNYADKGGDMIRVNTGFAVQEWPLSGRNLKDNTVKSALSFLAQCKKLSGLNTLTITSPNDYPDNPFGKVDHPAAADVSNVPSLIPANCLLDDFVTADTKTTGAPADGADTSVGFRPGVDFPYLDVPYGAYGSDGL